MGIEVKCMATAHASPGEFQPFRQLENPHEVLLATQLSLARFVFENAQGAAPVSGALIVGIQWAQGGADVMREGVVPSELDGVGEFTGEGRQLVLVVHAIERWHAEGEQGGCAGQADELFEQAESVVLVYIHVFYSPFPWSF